MIDERELLARTAQRFTMPEPRFERLNRRRDRKRRNERLAAGATGLTAAVAVVAIALAIAGGDAPGNAGAGPSPSDRPAGPVRFESIHHGYALTHPADWTATASPSAWTAGPLTGDYADAFRGVGSEGILLQAGSTEIPDGMTPAEWIDLEQRRAVEAAGGVVGGGSVGSIFRPTVVDGVDGSLSADCGVVLVVEDGRGYVFQLRGDITVNTDLRAVVRSIELHPEDAR